jgi:hypothetical protein
MGIETTKALNARRRESTARIERLIAQADTRSPMGSVRRARTREGARLARRRIRALATAQQTVAAIEIEIGQLLLRIIDQGLSRNEAFELAGLSRHLGRRYVELALSAQSQSPASLSTSSADDVAVRQSGSDLDPIGTHLGATAPGRKY